MSKHRYKLVTFLLMVFTVSAQAEQWQAQSAEKHQPVLELFTSEGCGLCPPAERYVHDLPEQGIDKEDLIVLGFHVDYLNDRKGWIDRFAKPEFTARQKQLAHLNRYQHVFTPEFIVSGETVHSWREQLVDVVDFLNEYPAEVDINLNITTQTNQLEVRSHLLVRGVENRQHSKFYLAITEDDVFSEVRGGDNAGRDFNHQNLVRHWLGPFELKRDGETVVTEIIPIDENWQLNKLKVVALVQNLSDGYVLQALAVPLND